MWRYWKLWAPKYSTILRGDEYWAILLFWLQSLSCQSKIVWNVSISYIIACPTISTNLRQVQSMVYKKVKLSIFWHQHGFCSHYEAMCNFIFYFLLFSSKWEQSSSIMFSKGCCIVPNTTFFFVMGERLTPMIHMDNLVVNSNAVSGGQRAMSCNWQRS